MTDPNEEDEESEVSYSTSILDPLVTAYTQQRDFTKEDCAILRTQLEKNTVLRRFLGMMITEAHSGGVEMLQLNLEDSIERRKGTLIQGKVLGVVSLIDRLHDVCFAPFDEEEEDHALDS